METVYNTWNTEKEGEIKISFQKAPYEHRSTILWRGQTIHLKIEGYVKEFGYGQFNILLYNNRRYNCGVEKYKYMGGSTGNNIPVITSGIFRLHYIGHISGARFYEETISRSPGDEEPESCHFEIQDTPESIVFEAPIVPKVILPTILLGDQYSITLYEYSDAKVNIDNLAYFDGEDLIVDYWRLTDNSEREKGIRIRAEDLKLVYANVNLVDSQKAELLLRLHYAFKGKDCFEKIKTYLNGHKITYKTYTIGEEK